MESGAAFRNLRIWQQSMELAEKVLLLAAKLPREEMFGLGSQIRRCAVSVPSNIAEGWGRNGSKEFLRFLNIAHGSLCELETQLELIQMAYHIDTKSMQADCVNIRLQVIAFSRKIEKEVRIQ